MQTLRDIISRNEHFYPDLDAYVDGDRRLTHAQFAGRARQLASALNELGVRHQDRVAVMSTNRLEYIELYGACEWAGYILTHVNFRLAAPEVLYILSDSTPRVVFFEEKYLALMESLRAQLPAVEHWVCIGGECAWSLAYGALADNGDPAGPDTAVAPGDEAHLVYTSGTTGRAKGVLSSHRRTLKAGECNATELEIRHNGCALITTPLFHVGAKWMRLGQSWRAGTCVLTGPTFDATEILRLIEKERGEVLLLVPEQLRQVVEALETGSFDVSSLRTITTAAAPIPVPLLRRAIARFGDVMMVQYGMTEGSWTTLYRHELRPDGTPEEIERIASVGHATPYVQLRVVDDRGDDCAAGVPGEIWARSDAMLERYWNNPQATAEALAGGWMHTGDVGYLDARGFLYLVDRKKDMIISAGENIYSREVENALNLHPAVIESAVVGRPDEKWGEVVHAFVVLQAADSSCADVLIEHCRTQIARYKCPKGVTVVTTLPRLATGKVDKVELRRLARESSQD
ncbi:MULTISPECIES: AMP-binding protein [unclassified Caballeronia]|uniref:class I adenylate-forming enzyme family protein n=1 Tax=unclassified Caballeronia TaxID=2646786 RepID=UPI00286459F4|nr:MULTISPECIES: AMP-binding protein [unclassified Caballeronia]MDR5777321.1 AMP-binding protein [Caballeronia sp. LZ002]MDR5852747.1 AMP-binding protein [Caballeronia sp. LZ003]